MDRYKLILLVCFLPLLVGWQEARMTPIATGGSTPVASSCDTCTDPLIFSWYAENANIETGTPCGCSQNATKDVTLSNGLAISDAQDSGEGSYSLFRGSTNDTGNIDITGASKTQGCISFDIYITAYPSSGDTRVVGISDAVDYDDYFLIHLTSASTVTATAMWHGGSVKVATVANPGTGAWKTGCYFYYRTGGSPYVYGSCGGNTGENTNAVSAMTDAPSYVGFGENDTSVGYFYLDNIKIYNTYDACIPP